MDSPPAQPPNRLWLVLGWIVDLGGAGLLLLLGAAAYLAGFFMNVLFVALLCGVPVAYASLVIGLVRHDLVWPVWRSPWHVAQLLNRGAFWLVAVYTVLFCVIPAQLGDQMRGVYILAACSAGALLLIQWVPRRRIFWAMNALFAAGSVFMLVQLWRITHPELAGAIELRPPFQGEWLIFQGGASGLVNHHHAVPSQRDAIDFVRLVDGRMARAGLESRKVLADIFAWGEPILAPADGTVVEAVSNLPDNPIGKTDAKNPAGNHVIIDLGGGLFVMLAHLQQKSVRVAKGERVQVGQELAKCGNSGNTSGPHLHIQVQTTAAFGTPGSRTVPIVWRGAARVRGVERMVNEPVAVRRNDVLEAGGPGPR